MVFENIQDCQIQKKDIYIIKNRCPFFILSLINNQRFMLQTLVVVTFWIIMYFIACAISPVVFFLMIIWTIYKIITMK
ncbi:hypothetical protein DW027_22450 [Bacteroides xylanisolvens]|uniref:Uncharacterized protein n=1 Tax=Bacteroides xylanisolvens TaxID=371601 RepID=A0A415KAV7_9BACE|nr:hypothetical protein DW027_22450 [Bacteroides xylanisolvens]